MTVSGGRRALCLLAALQGAWPLPSHGSSMTGTSAGEFLHQGAGARAAGMGDAQAAAADDATAVFWNPAALTQIPSLSVTFFHVPFLAGSSHGTAAYGHNLGRRGAVGLGLRYAAAGSSDRTDEAGAAIGSVSPSDRALSAGYAWKFQGLGRLRFLNGLSIGGAVKHVSSRIVEGAETVTADVGLLSKGYLRRRLQVAVTASNLVGRLRYGREDEPLPAEIRAGAAYQASNAWRLTADLAFPKRDEAESSLGVEYLRPLGSYKAALRGGYNTRWSGDRDGLSGVSAGFGLMAKTVAVDYFARFEGNGWMTQGVSLSWGFGARYALPEHVRALLDEARRLAAQNRFAEAVLKFDEALTEEPACREAREGLEEAARNLR